MMHEKDLTKTYTDLTKCSFFFKAGNPTKPGKGEKLMKGPTFKPRIGNQLQDQYPFVTVCR